MGGIFRTLGNTWNITKISASVLRKDKELLLFPVMSGVFVLIIVGIAVAIGASIGTLDRLDAGAGEEATLTPGDIVLGVLAIVAAIFAINYFNAALMGAARHRLKGGDPNLRTGFAAVNKHLGAVFGWSVISAIIFIILTYARAKTDSFIGRFVIGIVGAVWAYMTFFVVPILIVEGVGPIEAIKRSKGYFTRTWGEQLVSGFGVRDHPHGRASPGDHRRRHPGAALADRGGHRGRPAGGDRAGGGQRHGGHLQDGAL